MLDQPHWQELARLWDLSISIDVELQVLRRRLLQRWADHGLSQAEAAEKTNGSDLPNAKLVHENSLPCDVVIAGDQILMASAAAPSAPIPNE